MTRFKGAEYVPSEDASRLQTQHQRVRDFLLDITSRGMAATISEIASSLHIENQESVGRQIRYLRQDKFGGYRVESAKRKGSGATEWRVYPPAEPRQLELTVEK